MSATKGGSKRGRLTGEGVRGGLLIYLGAVGLISRRSKFESWAVASGMESVSFVVISTTIVICAYLAKMEKRWLAIPLCSLIAGVGALLNGRGV
nr:DUF3360 family protein [Vibrio vulnificus]